MYSFSIYINLELIPKTRDCSLALHLSGEPFAPDGTIDPNPKMNPPVQFQTMFDDDVEWNTSKKYCNSSMFYTTRATSNCSNAMNKVYRLKKKKNH